MIDLSLENIINICTHRKPGVVGKHRSFSVMLPLVEMEDGLHVLFELRSPDLDAQPGEVCFPGGAMEAGETPLQASVRETMEELGIKREDIKIINKLDTLQSHANLSIYCYLGIINTCQFNINKAEVAEIFTVPLSFFVENEPEIEWVDVVQIPPEDFPYEKVNSPKAYEWRSGKVDIPIYMYGEYPIWGLTARMMHNFIEILEGKRQ
ncbi:MAG: CoA pyrophosphatase [Anaerovoracaceae bacterium]|nr:CoA pyrophosphatase [Anaerovoracaceae bacterium]